jgi:methylmalonyl-CoA/ethylmalonyl-CoA epimerase
MIFERIERVAIGVGNLESTRDFFSDLLGITFDEPLVEERLNMKAVYSSFGLELVESTAPGTVIDKFVKERGEGVFCIVIKVTDMKKAVKQLENKGLRQAGELEFGGLREVAFHPKDAHGVQIVLAEYTAQHPATIAALQKQSENSG